MGRAQGYTETGGRGACRAVNPRKSLKSSQSGSLVLPKTGFPALRGRPTKSTSTYYSPAPFHPGCGTLGSVVARFPDRAAWPDRRFPANLGTVNQADGQRGGYAPAGPEGRRSMGAKFERHTPRQRPRTPENRLSGLTPGVGPSVSEARHGPALASQRLSETGIFSYQNWLLRPFLSQGERRYEEAPVALLYKKRRPTYEKGTRRCDSRLPLRQEPRRIGRRFMASGGRPFPQVAGRRFPMRLYSARKCLLRRHPFAWP